MSCLVKVFVLTKNEYDIIEDFINFYGNLVGYENIIVIDNDSTHPVVLDVYRRYLEKGLKHLYKTTDTMRNCASIISRHMHHFKTECKFMLPVDTDEFLFFKSGGEMTRERFESYLNSIPDNVSVIKFGQVLASVPDQESSTYEGFKHTRPAVNITNFYLQPLDKVFVKSEFFTHMAMGNHSAKVSGGKMIVDDSIGLLHFHETGAFRQYERAINAVTGYGFSSYAKSIQEQLADCHKWKMGAGGHHCRYMAMFLTRKLLIQQWKSRFTETLPSMEHVKIADELADDVHAEVKLMNFVKSLPNDVNGSVDSPQQLDKLLFGNWKFSTPEHTITQCRDFILSLE